MAEQRWQARDGDSLYTEDGGTTRLLGIDAPEKASTARPDMPGSEAATSALQQALDNGAQVRATGAQGYHGRDLQRVTDDRGDVAADMVARGLADPDRTTMNALNSHWLNELNGDGPIRPEWDAQAQQASRERMEFIENRFHDLMATAEDVRVRGYGANPNTDTVGRAATDALARGTDQFQGTLYGFADVIGGLTGADAFEKWGRDGMLRNMTEAAMNPSRVESYEDIDGLGTFGMYVLETIMEETPALGADIAVGLATGGSMPVLAGIGKAALRAHGASSAVGNAGKIAGQAYKYKFSQGGFNTGLFGSAHGQMTGETRQGQFGEGLANEDEANAYALGVGSAKAVTEFVGLRRGISNILRGADPDDAKTLLGIAKEAKDVRSFMDALGRGIELGVDSGLTEGVTELSQSLMDQLGNQSLDPDQDMDLSSIDAHELIESGLRGAIFGGTVGTAGSTAAGVVGAAQNRDRLDNEQQRRDHGETIPSDAATDREPVSDLKTHARNNGRVWMSSTQTPEDVEAAVSALREQGKEAYARPTAEGGTFVTADPNDSLLTSEADPTGADFARSNGYTPKEELNPDEPLYAVQAVDADSNIVTEAGTDETNLTRTVEAVRRNAPDAQVRVVSPEDMIAQRRQRREAQDDVSGLREADPTFEAPELAPIVGRELGQFESAEAAELADQQAERSVPTVESQRGQASLFRDGRLRPTGELIADFRAGRLNREELKRILKNRGINPDRFVSKKPVIDEQRTRDAIRTKLMADRKLAAEFAGSTYGRPHELADQAMLSLENAGERELRRAAKQVGVDALPPAVPADAQAERVIRGRITSTLNKKKFPTPIKRQLAERFMGDANQYQGLVGHARALQGEELVRFAEAAGVKIVNLTAPTEESVDDVVGVFRELAERTGTGEAGPSASEPTPNQQSQQARAGEPSAYQQIRESFDWLFDGDGQAIPAATVIEQRGGPAKAQQEMADTLTRAIEQIPELGGEIERRLDRGKARSKTQRLPALIEATQRTFTGMDADPEADTGPSEAETSHRMRMHEAVRDIALLRRLPVDLDMDKVTDLYWKYTSLVSEEHPVARLKSDLEAVEAQADPADVDQTLQILTQSWEKQKGLEPGAFYMQLESVALSNPTEPEIAVLESLFAEGLLGGLATRRQHDPFTGRVETVTANIPSRDRGANPNDASFEEALTPQEQSDRLLFQVMNRASLKLPRFFDMRNAKLPESQWTEGERSYQEARHYAVVQPGEVYNTRNDPEGPLQRLGMFFSSAIFHDGLSDRNASDIANAAWHTRQAKGLNLILVEFESPAGPYPRFVDAVTLSRYRKGGEPSTLADALENLEDNLARLADGLYFLNENAEEGQDPRPPIARAASIPTIPDDMVIWQDHNGQQYTAAQAREARNQQRSDRNRVAEAAARRDEVAQELEEVNQYIDAALDQLQDAATDQNDERALKHLAALNRAISENDRREQAGERRNHKAEGEPLNALGNDVLVKLSDGVIGTLRNALTKRFDLYREIKALNQYIGQNADQMRTSLQGERSVNEQLERESQPEIDEDGFDQQMARGEDARAAENSAYEELRDDSESTEGYQGLLGRPDEELNTEIGSTVPEGELTEQEARVQYLQYGESTFYQKAPELRGFQIDAVPRPRAQPEQGQPRARPAPRRGVQRVGRAANRRDFQALESFTRRMMALVSRGQPAGERRFSETPVTIIETGDQAALEQLAQEAGHAAPPGALRALYHAPGYLNLHGRVVIAMDRKPPRGSRAEWMMTFGHELGHLFYDQSWHVLPQSERGAIQQEFIRGTGGNYNGKTGTTAFKEWFADQMSSAIADDAANVRRSEYLDGNGPLQKALRLMVDRLRKLWNAIQQEKSVRRLARYKRNDTFAKYAKRVLRGEVPLRHRYETDTLETLHYTLDEQPMPPRGAAARARQAITNPAKHAFSGLVRSAIGRIRSYNTELGDSLFQASNRNRTQSGSYEQKRYALHNRYAAWFQGAFDRIEKRSRKQAAAVDQAYADLRDGRDTEGAGLLREAIDQVIRDARREGWHSSPEFAEGSLPRAYDHKAMQARRGEFFEMAQEALPNVSADDINERIDRIINGFGLEDLEHEPMGPGKAVGTQSEAALLMDAIGTEQLAEAGFLQDRGAGILHHFAAGLGKRTAWESVMGGWTANDGSYSPETSERVRRIGERTGQMPFFDPNARYKYLLEQVKNEHGERAEREVRDLVSGALGHRNLDVHSKVRSTQEWITGVSNMMILGFSGVMSIPEVAIAPVRAGFNPKDIMDALGGIGEARKFAKDIGAVMTTGAEQIARESIGEGYQSNLLTKASNVFFTANGQQFVTRASRTFATAIGMRFVLKAAQEGDYRSLEKLGLTPQDVAAWNQAGRPAFTPDMDGPVAEVARKVSAGISQFVNDGTLNPNKFQATGWGSNPYLKLIWQLKQFLWTMGDTVISATARRVQEQYAKGRSQGYTVGMSAAMASLPAQWLMGLSLPLVYLALSLRGLLAGDDDEPLAREDGMEKIYEMTRRAGFFAQWEMLHGIRRAWQWEDGAIGKGVAVAGALAPSVGVASDILEVEDWEVDLAKSRENLKDYVPLASQWKGTWQWLLD